MYEKPKVNRIWYIVLGVVGVTLLLLGLLALLVNSMNKGEEASTGTTEQTTGEQVTTESSSVTSEQVTTETTSVTSEQVTTEAASTASEEGAVGAAKPAGYTFRKKSYKDQHYEKHGKEMGFPDADAYEAAANEVISDPSSLHKIEKEDGDDVYYRESDNSFVIVSTDGYIRTFFYPSGGKAYYDRQ